MSTYRYVGNDSDLFGHTALGTGVSGEFKVQVDELHHHMSRGWHSQDVKDWERFPDYVRESLCLALDDMEVFCQTKPFGTERPNYYAGFAVMCCCPKNAHEPFVAWMIDADGEEWVLKRRQAS